MLLLALLSLGLSAEAATYSSAMDLEDLSAEAERVVLGEVRSTRAFRVPGGVSTEVVVSVYETLAGEPAPEVRLVIPGGHVGATVLTVPGAPRFLPGHDVVLFLDESGLVGFGQGAFLLEQGEAWHGLGNEVQVPGVHHDEEQRYTLDEIRRAVR